ncbi:BTAD domain-containing putative transcriptional regulator [Tabrizicola sp. BL-A-41-H6]|uniref:BTAD domain-containing putative transcriptional regulator n=1 Tax=Tabrizicola sp. BL-A-41-H6 TaxID=3421107 RepID=UPI003D67731F
MRIEIQILGGFSVTVDGVLVAASLWRRDRAAALVKLLAVTPQHRMHREQVLDLFWPEADSEVAGAALRKAVHYARKALGQNDLISTNGDSLALAPLADLVIDAETFEAAASAALRQPTPETCGIAADLYRGRLLPDDLYFDWLDARRTGLAQRHIDLLRAGQLWQRLIAVEPSDEPAQCALMQAALDSGNRAEAIRIFNQLRQSLHMELGLGPSAEAVALYEKALAIPTVDPVSQTDRIRASLAWGLLHLHSGDFEKARAVAEETRALAMAAGLAREVGEASALMGLCAMMQGRWKEVFHSEFIAWARKTPDKVAQVFDGHLCLAEFCLCNAKGHHEIGLAAQELLSVAEGAGSTAGRGLALMILGEVALFSGQIGEAERLLTEAEALLAKAEASAGRVLALERLAEIALSSGRNWQAKRLIARAEGIAATSWLAPHLQIRLKGLSVRAAGSKEKALEAIHEGDRLLSQHSHGCQPCSMGFRVASASALAEMGELDQVGRRLDEAERISAMWHGGPWVAAVWEARGIQRRAEKNDARAVSAFEEAAGRYASLGRPTDETRCRSQISRWSGGV